LKRALRLPRYTLSRNKQACTRLRFAGGAAGPIVGQYGAFCPPFKERFCVFNIGKATALYMIGLSTKRIREDLADWYPVSRIVEQIQLAISMNGGVTADDIRRLTEYQKRWLKLPESTRLFYSKNYTDESVSCALWYVLSGQSGLIKPNTEMSVNQRFKETMGYESPFNLFPKIQ
jgi:hypothetical protein